MPNDILQAETIYHIYNRGNNLENIFIEERNYNYFLSLLEKYVLPIAEIYAYCMLKNHFHIVLKIKEKAKIPEKYRDKIHLPFSNMFNTYTKSINKAYHRTGSLFQENPKRNKVENEDYLRQLIVYIHLNPLKHKFLNQFELYNHSSYSSYLSNAATNLEREYVYELFGGKENFIYFHNENQIKYEGLINEIDQFDY